MATTEEKCAPWSSLLLDAPTRAEIWARLAAAIEDYIARVPEACVTPELKPAELHRRLARFDFQAPLDALEAVDWIIDGLWRYQVHTPHPRYFGLFNPAPVSMGIAADTLVAAFNPQLAAWSHSPLAAEIEAHVVRAVAVKLGYPAETADGTFASGGMEANHTALLCALQNAFPAFAETGARGLERPPVLYVSSQTHHSIARAARLCGLGASSARTVAVDDDLRMRAEDLSAQVRRDREAGFAPFLVVATAGTTNAGIIDPLDEIADAAQSERLWFHVDAAWGGAAAIVPEMRHLLAGIERSDSLILDAHKWLSAPMGAGIFLTRKPDILRRTFGVSTAYMPRDAAGLDITDPHTHSMQWSRRFTGLKVFLALAVAGWDGYAAAIRHQTAMGNLLREELRAAGRQIVNRTELPVVCFAGKGDPEEIVRRVVTSGAAWISTTRLRDQTVIRACITNYRTQPEDIRALVEAVSAANERK